MSSWPDGTSGMVTLPDGRRVRGRALRLGPAAPPEEPEYGVYLTARPVPPQRWPAVWVHWPDFRLPADPTAAVDAIAQAHELSEGLRVEVACDGGLGRTGTAIALMARLSGVPAADAVGWTREHYNRRAVETPWQRRFVARTVLPESAS